ncbi:flagellinolysin [Lysinibacillus endophyticus]|uniref:flagellinolysin n=1 Tax=Ureibacillus endophyticus TaxID=1978490 RepID=UPI003135685E
MRIRHNISALNTFRNLNVNNKKSNQSLEKLSTGLKINRAGDDAAGLAISEKMRAQIHGLNIASKNIQDGISLIQTAEGGMTEIHDMLQRVRELTVQSANDTNMDSDRDKIVQEVESILEEINSISERTEFNRMKVLRAGGVITPPRTGPGGGGGGSTIGNPLMGDALTAAREALVTKMVESALESSEDYITANYGIQARSGATMEVKFESRSPGGSVAWVSSSIDPTTGAGVNYDLVFDEADVFTDGELWIDLDRIVAHEMTHAMMFASGMNYYGLPGWFKEGAAEYLAGAKERLTQSVTMLGANNVVNLLDGSGSHFYSAGYAATMYLDAKLRSNGKTIADLMGVLAPQSHQNTPMGGTLPGRAPTLDEALKTIFGPSYGETVFKTEFRANGAAFISDVLTNGGIGSIAEVNGVDGNGMLTFDQATYTNDNFIADSGNPVDESDNFDFNWTNTTPYDNLYSTTPYEIFRSSAIASNGEIILQLGANSGQSISHILPTITYESLGLADIDVKNLPDYSLQALDGAIEALSTERSKLGAIQNRLEHAYNNVLNASENLTASESRIRDTNMAREMMNQTKQNILMQAAQTMLAQANEKPQSVLQLIGN